MLEFLVDNKNRDLRLDAFLADVCPEFTRSQLKKSIDSGNVLVNGLTVTKASKKLILNDRVELLPPVIPDLMHPDPENLPLDILFSDEHILVINKPSGLVVHPGAGHLSGTLVNAVLNYDPNIASVGQPDRPGIVHRLDGETSGLLLVARSQLAYEKLILMFSTHEVHRQYWSICYAPNLPDSGTFDTPYGRHPTQRIKFTSFATNPSASINDENVKRAITHYHVLSRNNGGFALITCNLETGRTHQIRVHLSEHGAPILGDTLYAPEKIANHRAIQRLALHAGRLSFNHPVTNQPLMFNVSLPPEFTNALETLKIEIPSIL